MDKKEVFADVEIELILQLGLLAEQAKLIITKEKKEKDEKEEEKSEFDMNLNILFDSFLDKDLFLKHHASTVTPLSIAQALPTPPPSSTTPTSLSTIPAYTLAALSSSSTTPTLSLIISTSTLATLLSSTTSIIPTSTTIPALTLFTLSLLITSPITISMTTFFNDTGYYSPTLLSHFTYIH
jgi:hypothetical protein